MIKIKLFSDYIWPYCYIGKGIVESLKETYDFEIEHIAFEIHPETPQAGRSLKDTFPGYDQMIGQLKAFGAQHQIAFGDVTHIYHTHKALLIGELAADHQKGSDFADIMFKAYFVDGLNINDEKQLIALAAKVGLSEVDVLAALKSDIYEKRLKDSMALGHEYGITSVPTFIINNEYKIVGSQSRETIKKVFDEILSKK